MLKRLTFFIFFLQISSYAQLIPFRINNLWGYSDTGKQIRIKPAYDFADFFDGELAFVKKDSLFYGINPKGEVLTPAIRHYGKFENGLCPVLFASGNSYYINRAGKVSIDQTFDAAENFSEGRAVVSLNKKLGIIDTSGRWIRKPDFDTSSLYFRSGMLLAISKGQYFYIRRDGSNLHLPDSIQPGGIFSEGLAPVYVTKPFSSTGERIKTTYLEFIDSTGRVVLQHFVNDSVDYSEYIVLEKEFKDGKAIIKSRNDIGWDYYFIDKQKRFSPLYSAARHLGDSLFLGAIGYYMSEIRILDSNFYVSGQFQQKPTQVGTFGNGLLAYRDKEGNWGYIDNNCKTVIRNKYSLAFTFSNGYAFVVLNGYYGVIDTKGREFFMDKP